MTRDEIIALVREFYDPEPRDWPRHRGWDDGTGEIADRLLRRMIPNPVMAMTECPKCGIRADSFAYRFCTMQPCPVNKPSPAPAISNGHQGGAT